MPKYVLLDTSGNALGEVSENGTVPDDKADVEKTEGSDEPPAAAENAAEDSGMATDASQIVEKENPADNSGMATDTSQIVEKENPAEETDVNVSDRRIERANAARNVEQENSGNDKGLCKKIVNILTCCCARKRD